MFDPFGIGWEIYFVVTSNYFLLLDLLFNASLGWLYRFFRLGWFGCLEVGKRRL
jgi:hypothetical protein